MLVICGGTKKMNKIRPAVDAEINNMQFKQREPEVGHDTLTSEGDRAIISRGLWSTIHGPLT
jgi:hypothetical protein